MQNDLRSALALLKAMDLWPSGQRVIARAECHIEQLERDLAAANERIAMIERSELVEVDGVCSESDGCGKPVLRSVGKILVPMDQLSWMQVLTNTAQELANAKRDLAAAISAKAQVERERDALKAYMFAHLRHKDPIVKEPEHIVGRWEEAEQAK